MAYAHIVITNFFIGQGKIVLDRKLFPMFCRPPPFSGWLRGKVIKGRIRPGISYKVKVVTMPPAAAQMMMKAIILLLSVPISRKL